jgi:hypothetical protein
MLPETKVRQKLVEVFEIRPFEDRFWGRGSSLACAGPRQRLCSGHIRRCVHDSDVTALHETSTEVAVGLQAVLDSWKTVQFESFAELSCVMTNPAIKVCYPHREIAPASTSRFAVRKSTERFCNFSPLTPILAAT